MKRLLTLLFLCIVCAGFSQTYIGQRAASGIVMPTQKLSVQPMSNFGSPSHFSPASSRSQNVNFFLDYGFMDSCYAANVTLGTYYNNNILQLNRRLPLDSAFTLKWAWTWYPRLFNTTDGSVWPFTEYNPSKLQMTIDSIYVTLGHIHGAAPAHDTIQITVWDLDAMANISFDSGATGTLYGKIIATTDSSITGPGSAAGTIQVGTFPFHPTTPIVIPQGKRFVIQVDFFGPASDQFYLGAAHRLDCASTCGSSLPYVRANYNANLVNFNSEAGIRYINTADSTQNGVYPVIPDFFSDCNQNGTQDTANCEYFTEQDYDIFPFISAVIPNFYASVNVDKPAACPGDIVTLTASAAGSSATPYTYAWTTSSGSLSSSTSSPVQLVVGNTNATVIVTVTDSAHHTTNDTITVTSRGINVSITNTRPVTVACGSTVVLTTTVSGNQTGKNYTWSTGVTGASKFTITVDSVATYVVTASNSFGCSSADSVMVTYAGGVNNVVNFHVPAVVCLGAAGIYTNRSTDTLAPWTAIWRMGDAGNTEVLTITANYTYSALGAYTITLEMDSGLCKFYSAPQQIIVHPLTYSGCLGGIDEVSFASAISLFPNPTNGNLTLNINGIEKGVSVKVYNILGSEITSFSSNDVATTFTKNFDFSELSGGTYLIKIQSGDKVAVKKFTIGK